MRVHISVSVILISLTSMGQEKNYLSKRYSIERMSGVGAGSGSILPGLPLGQPDVIGDPFLSPTFSNSIMLLYNEQIIRDVPTKYDMLSDMFYFQSNQVIRVLSGPQVKSFISIDSLSKKQSTYINAKEFKTENGIPLIGFFEIIEDVRIALLKKSEAVILKANYNPTLNVGSRDHKVKKKSEYFYLKDNVTYLLPAPKNFTKIFGTQKEVVEKYMKINQLNPKDERHLKLIFEYYDQIDSKK